MNKSTVHNAPLESMHFGGTLYRVIRHALTAEPRLGVVYLSKLDLDDAYIYLWLRVEDFPSIAFLFPKNNEADDQFVGFHMLLPIGFVNSAPYFS